MNTRRSSLLLFASLLTFSTGASSQEQDLTDLDLETLMGMDVAVTSASRRAQATADSAAAVYVITREDIRRSGATNVPELLRGVPGVHVARINGRGWAVTSRGFSTRFANKLLVMVDGRSIYTSVFSGVLWEEQSVALDEIERVEIVRGPGGALWGINAVNGVINIITRKAADASGLNASVGAGSIDERSATVSYGGSATPIGDYRMYVDHAETDSMGASPAWSHTQGGWRLDRGLLDGSFTFQGDINSVDYGPMPPPPAVALPIDAEVGNVSASWERSLSWGKTELRSYYGWTDRGIPGRWSESVLGFDAQFSAERIGAHVLTLGTGYRNSVDELQEPWPILSTAVPKVVQDHWSVYAQDEIYFLNDDVRVTLGAKLEDLEFGRPEFQPTLRTLWGITDTHTVWAAASRAVRTPSRLELNTQVNLTTLTEQGMLATYRVIGDEGLEAESLHAYELGWRWRALDTLSVDLALYRNEYERLINGNPLPPSFEFGPPPTIVLGSQFANLGDGRSDGAELVVEWAAHERLRLEAQGTWQNRRSDAEGGLADPKRMFMVRARVDLPWQAELDFEWRSISRLPGADIDGYDALDARAAWRATESLELSLSMDNVLDNTHAEFRDDVALNTGARLGRSYFARLTWRPKR